MRTGRKTRLRRILRRKRVKRAIKAYGNYIAAGVLVFVVCVAVVGAAVKPTASTLPKNTPEPVQNAQTTENTTGEAEAYPFNLMSFDWDGEALRWDASCKEGSTGYMQVLPKWHKERMRRLNVDNVENPYFNVLVGVDYLAELQERFDTEAEVLTAYNYGVTGAYEHVWNKGLTETEYSREVQQAKERIERRMRGEW